MSMSLSPRFVWFWLVPCLLYFDLSSLGQFHCKFMAHISLEHFSPCKSQDREKKIKLHKSQREEENFQRARSKNYQNKHDRLKIVKIGMKIFYNNKQAQKCLNSFGKTGDKGRKIQINTYTIYDETMNKVQLFDFRYCKNCIKDIYISWYADDLLGIINRKFSSMFAELTSHIYSNLFEICFL